MESAPLMLALYFTFYSELYIILYYNYYFIYHVICYFIHLTFRTHVSSCVRNGIKHP
jgi:hypothetical protein